MTLKNVHKYIVLTLLIGFSSFLNESFFNVAFAQQSCSGDALISETFSNGAQWDMCWESRIRENLVLSDVSYTPPNGEPKRIFSTARLSQLHVAYDDNDVTYNDITQYGLGGGYLVELNEQDCPLGELLTIQTRPALCLWRSTETDSYRTATRTVNAESLTLFSVSQVGAYAYIVMWKFYSDGAIEPQIGATGALQRNSDELELPFGRLLQGDDDTLWLSHTHNYYWRLDFDLGDSANDDVVTESRVLLNNDGQRVTTVERFDTEQARIANPGVPVSWEIWDNPSSPLSENINTGYRIEPVRYGHKLVRTEAEPYTEFDFFATVANECERFASQNARFNPDCLNNVNQFVNGEALDDADIMLWHRVSFHHVPRNEDQRHMHTHWDGFTIEPINVHVNTAGVDVDANAPPVMAALENRSDAIGASIDWQLSATDSDNDQLQFGATGLPPGVTVSRSGRVAGSPTTSGNYNVSINVSDGISNISRQFNWSVPGSNQSGGESKGFFGAIGPALLLPLVIVGFLRRFSLRKFSYRFIKSVV